MNASMAPSWIGSKCIRYPKKFQQLYGHLRVAFLFPERVYVTTTTEQQNAINVAAIQVEVAHLKVAVADLRTANAELDRKLDQVLAQLAEARGGWRTLMLIGGAAGSLGSGITWIISHLKG